MNLRKKKLLAMKALNVGKERIVFVKSRLDEIKEAITKQDIRDLHKEGAILIKNVQGRKTVKQTKKKRGSGKIRKKLNKRKENYIKLTRKLRKHASDLVKSSQLTREELIEVRKGIRNSVFRSKAHLKEQINEMRK
ncbi:MAG TPA: 50S ribosomal protein L19e [Candidatus Nanoarchaeia archaeon]|nr:50S ribosomal protein L19e [Candidatus Nanoarchaeia archaeon]